MDHMELPHRHGNNEELSRLEHCMQAVSYTHLTLPTT